jgi:hypothetical protein
MNTTTNIVIGLAVLALLLVRQLRRRTVKEDGRPVVLLVLAVIGVVQLADYVAGHPVAGTAAAMLVASVALAAAFGAVRAYTVRLWREDGVLYQQGSLVTVALWIVSIAVHYGADLLIAHNDTAAQGLANAALLLYIAVSFGVQRLVVRSRSLRAAV